MTVPVAPEAIVSEVTEGVMLGPAKAGTTETVYVTVEVVTDLTVIVKLRGMPEDGSSPKLKLAWPSPFDCCDGLASRVAVTSDAAARSILPPPLLIGLDSEAPFVGLFTGLWAEFTRADLTCSGDQSGWSCMRSAAEPATWGVAMLVPWKKAKHGGLAQAKLGTEEYTFTPGAVTSGLILS